MQKSDTDICPNEVAAELSELLLAWTATGKGIHAPAADHPGMVFTSAIPDLVYRRYTTGLAAFNDREALARIPEKEQLEALDKQLKNNGKTRRGEAECPTAYMNPVKQSDEVLERQAKNLREHLNKLPLVAWDDPQASRSTLLDLATSKSLYATLTIMDARGARASMAMCSSMCLANEASLAALTGRTSHNDAFVRSSATGGATIFSTNGSDRPAVNYFCCAPPDVVGKLTKRVVEKTHGAPMRGLAVSIRLTAPEAYAPRLASTHYDYLAQQILRLGAKAPGERLTLDYASEDLRADWELFLTWGYEAFSSVAKTEFAEASCAKMEASFATITAFATRAACMQAVLDNMDCSIKNLSGTRYLLQEKHLQQAKRYAAFLVRHSLALSAKMARADNAAKARESRVPGSELMVKLAHELEAAIRESERGMVSRKRALAIDKMSATALDILAAGPTFQELIGKDVIQMGKTERAYCLRAAVSMDADEAVAELEAATKEFAEHPERFSDGEALEVFTELNKAAEANEAKYYLPCVPIDQMTSRQIRCIPLILAQYSPFRVILRGGSADDPEPKQLYSGIERDPDDDDPFDELILKPGVANLWFRCNTQMQDFRNWSRSNLGFEAAWQQFRDEGLDTNFSVPKQEGQEAP